MPHGLPRANLVFRLIHAPEATRKPRLHNLDPGALPPGIRPERQRERGPCFKGARPFKKLTVELLGDRRYRLSTVTPGAQLSSSERSFFRSTFRTGGLL